MRTLHVRHPSIRCIAEALLDLFPTGADVSEVGLDTTLALFVNWRTTGPANRPGNIAWGVHYRFDAQVLRGYPHLSDEARRRVCDRVREMSRLLDFNYADPQASSLLVVDVDETVLAA